MASSPVSSAATWPSSARWTATAPSSPALSAGVQSPAPDVALDLRGRSELAGGLLHAPQSTKGCGVEPALEELGVASNGTRPAPEELAGGGPVLWTATARSSRGASTWRR
ncbi:hypothetical protein WME94_40790 [Sorangium sp. So ce429]